MEQPLPQFIIDLVGKISYAGVAALAILVIFRPLVPVAVEWIKNKMAKRVITDEHKQALGKVGSDVQLLGSNHIHTIHDLLVGVQQTLTRMESNQVRSNDNQTQMLGEIQRSLAYIEAKTNGRSH